MKKELRQLSADQLKQVQGGAGSSDSLLEKRKAQRKTA